MVPPLPPVPTPVPSVTGPGRRWRPPSRMRGARVNTLIRVRSVHVRSQGCRSQLIWIGWGLVAGVWKKWKWAVAGTA